MNNESMNRAAVERRRVLTRWALMIFASAALTACGGDSGSPTPPSDPTVGGPTQTAAVTIPGPAGSSVTVPPGALSAPTTIRIATDSAGAPAVPAELTTAGSMYAITPHGAQFAAPVEVRIPASAATLQPNQLLALAKAQPGGEWEVLLDTARDGDVLVAKVDSFSYFVPVFVNFARPLTVQRPAFAVTSTELTCAGEPCDQAVGSVAYTYTVVANGGELPSDCSSGRLEIGHILGNVLFGPWSPFGSFGATLTPVSTTGGSISGTVSPSSPQDSLYFDVRLKCTNAAYSFGPPSHIRWVAAGRGLSILRAPAQVDVVAGLPASVEIVLSGGASATRAPTAADRAVIDWQRSDNGGASWATVAQSYENEANPRAENTNRDWWFWSVRHSFVASAADHGALIRARACYTPPDAPPPPCVTGPAARINVLQQSALPQIATAPRSVLVRAGQTASFSAGATGLPAPTLQWQTRVANSTGAWADVTNGTGATTGNYTTPPMTLADNGREYRVVATNALGTAESAAVTVSVSDLDVAPTITIQPANLTVMAGSDAVFAVDARGTEALSYQWARNGTPIVGANAAVLRIAAATAGDAGSYTVTVSNSAGSVTSNAAVLTVTTAPSAVPVAPTIVTQPVDTTVAESNTATLAVAVNGTPPFTYQWSKGGTPISGATAAVYTIASVSTGDAGSYSVTVSNSAGSVTSNAATLTVNAAAAPVAPSITAEPTGIVIAPGGTATFAVAATGTGPLSYQWRRNGADVGGATTPVLTLANVNGGNAGSYSVVVSNAWGSVTSNAVPLIVLGAPAITAQPSSASVAEGQSATFSVAASGPDLRYQWLRNGVAIGGANGASYTTPATTIAADSGAVFSVVVYNNAGAVFSNGAVLTVTAPVVALSGIRRVSVASDGTQANGASDQVAISADGRYVAFRSAATNLVPGDTNGCNDVFVHDRVTGTTKRVSVASDSTQGNGHSGFPSISADGRYIAFLSGSTNLVPGDTFSNNDVFVHDQVTGQTTRVNETATAVSMANHMAAISGDGMTVAFGPPDSTLIDTGGQQQVAIIRWQTRDIGLASALPDGTPGDGNSDLLPGSSFAPAALSTDGSRVLFRSYAPNLTPSLPHGLLVCDYPSRACTHANLSPTGAFVAHGAASLAANGLVVAFESSQDFVVGDANGASDIFVRDLSADTTTRVSTASDGTSGDSNSTSPTLSGDGRYVAFYSAAQNLIVGSTTSLGNMFVHDRTTGQTRQASLGVGGVQPNGVCTAGVVSANGNALAFVCFASNMVSGDTNGVGDVFVGPRP